MTSKSKTKIRDEWLVIVNPNAGKRKGEKDWKKISGELDEQGFKYKSLFTEHRFHAIDLSQDHINNGYTKIIVAGGDGTLNEVINGIFAQSAFPTTEITVGHISIGTGNDWGKMFNIPKKYPKAIKTIADGNTFIQDAGKVKYQLGKKGENRYFINMAGMGYDALVAQKTNKMKEKGGGGPIAYLYNLFLGLFQYHKTFFEIEIDDKKVYSGEVFSMSIGICKYNGGGMMQLPNAVPDDGIFDVTVFNKNATKTDVFKHLKKLYDGTFINLPIVDTYTGKHIKIYSRPKNTVYLETDGESLGHSPLTFEIIPRSIKVITGKDWNKS